MTANLETRKWCEKSPHSQSLCSTSCDSYPETLAGGEFPFDVSIKRSNVDSSRDIDTLGEVIDVLQWTLDTIKDGAHDSRSEFH